jgi:hypothetical protein
LHGAVLNAPKHPDQPVVIDEQGTARFKSNAIVDYLLEAGPFDLNHLALIPFGDEDRSQFAQLIGYSVSGFGELSYADPESVRRADAEAWNQGLEKRDAERREARRARWLAEKGFPPLGEEPGQVRVFRYDIQQWVEVPANCIVWGPDTKAVTCRAELTCRFEFGTPPGYEHYVPYVLAYPEERSEWAVRISFKPEAPNKPEGEEVSISGWLRRGADEWDRKQASDSWHEFGKDNPIISRARRVFREDFPNGLFQRVEATNEGVFCRGVNGPGETPCYVKLVSNEARLILEGSLGG